MAHLYSSQTALRTQQFLKSQNTYYPLYRKSSHQQIIKARNKNSRKNQLTFSKLDQVQIKKKKLDKQKMTNSNQWCKANSKQIKDEQTNFTSLILNSQTKKNDQMQKLVVLITQQNRNLKQQNQYLFKKLKQLQSKNKKLQVIQGRQRKYKKLYQECAEEVKVFKQKCQAYQVAANQMKLIALSEIVKLERKLQPLISTRENSSPNQSYEQKNLLQELKNEGFNQIANNF